jgi:hypothetical protein
VLSTWLADTMLTTAHDTGGFLPQPVFVALIMALVMWVVVYMLYKLVMTERKDFGMPIRRRLLCKRLRVDHDQSAEVPFWWTDLQVQLAVRNHWKQTLRGPVSQPPDPHPSV